MHMSIKSRLPSKKFIIGSAITAVILVVVIIIHSRTSSSRVIEEKYAGITVGDIIDRDTNSDGVTDWQERLYELQGISPDNWSALAASTQTANPDEQPLNQTETLARDMYVIITALSQDAELHPKIQENLSALLSDYLSSDKAIPLFTEADITTVHNSLSATRNYAQAYAAALSNLQNVTDPTIIVGRAVQNEDPAALKGLVAIQSSYESAATQLANVTVPDEVLPYHLFVLNAVHKIAFDIGQMQYYFEDPLLTFSGIILYNKHIEEYVLATETLNNDILLPITKGLR